MDAIIIDPTRLNDQTKPLLQAFLDCPPETTLNAGELYQLELFSGARIVKLTLCLTHTIHLHSYKSKPFQCKADVYEQGTELDEGGEPQIEGVLEIAKDIHFRPKGEGKVKRLVNFFEKLAATDLNATQEWVLQTIDINPTKLTDKTKPLLQAFLDNTDKIKFRRSKVFFVELHTELHTIEIPIRFTNSLLIRPKKSNPTLSRIEVFDTLIGSGGEGGIYSTLGILEVENDLHFNTKPKKEHVIKAVPLARRINLPAGSAEKIRKIKEKPVRKEELKTNLASSFLRCHAALFSKQTGYLVMNRAEGEDLFYIIEKLGNGEIKLSETGLILLTLAIIKAVKKLHQKGLMHRDLKSENIVVDLKTWKIVIVDHTAVRQVPKDNPTQELRCKFRKGTLIYMPPESLGSEKIISQAGDLYALGLIIAELWGDLSLSDFMVNNKANVTALKEWQKKDNRFELFKGMNVSTEVQEGINAIVYGLTQYKANDRMPLTIADEHCNTLLLIKNRHVNYNPSRKSNRIPPAKASENRPKSEPYNELLSEKESENDNVIKF